MADGKLIAYDDKKSKARFIVDNGTSNDMQQWVDSLEAHRRELKDQINEVLMGVASMAQSVDYLRLGLVREFHTFKEKIN
ncbi:hypothetical protein ACH5RR_026396 [Cinchona calisaya]|uniref:PH domain-containing protein n=1 Tax=Cinchona calisaya TaxID=153742 RepID=A0ABD2Z3K3_9GENT